MMDKQTRVLQMAIEMLEMYVPYYVKDRGCEAINACKEALAEQPTNKEWQGLSDAEIEEVYGKVSAPMGERRIYEVHTLAKALEAKLKEKNG